ncbi:hypothetical protein KC322_g44 [Hortaea werneckii]|nr:hypothetical protein KC322_g44 [Hortaea werneckii]
MEGLGVEARLDRWAGLGHTARLRLTATRSGRRSHGRVGTELTVEGRCLPANVSSILSSSEPACLAPTAGFDWVATESVGMAERRGLWWAHNMWAPDDAAVEGWSWWKREEHHRLVGLCTGEAARTLLCCDPNFFGLDA